MPGHLLSRALVGLLRLALDGRDLGLHLLDLRPLLQLLPLPLQRRGARLELGVSLRGLPEVHLKLLVVLGTLDKDLFKPLRLCLRGLRPLLEPDVLALQPLHSLLYLVLNLQLHLQVFVVFRDLLDLGIKGLSLPEDGLPLPSALGEQPLESRLLRFAGLLDLLQPLGALRLLGELRGHRPGLLKLLLELDLLLGDRLKLLLLGGDACNDGLEPGILLFGGGDEALEAVTLDGQRLVLSFCSVALGLRLAQRGHHVLALPLRLLENTLGAGL
mmetsp:Transcript_12829/g.39997  ORF Transcript_12829/g.39997 Transcript_12829/m.39997 type:complete len:272 (-) Transcript_12829:132-947(-)